MGRGDGPTCTIGTWTTMDCGERPHTDGMCILHKELHARSIRSGKIATLFGCGRTAGAGIGCTAFAFVVVTEIGYVPPGTLKLKTGRRNLFDIRTLLALRAIGKNGIGHFLKNILLMSAS